MDLKPSTSPQRYLGGIDMLSSLTFSIYQYFFGARPNEVEIMVAQKIILNVHGLIYF